MTYNALLDEMKKLPLQERLKLLDALYETIDSEDAPVALTPEQNAELSRRIEAYKDRPEQWISLEHVEAEVDRLLARK